MNTIFFIKRLEEFLVHQVLKKMFFRLFKNNESDFEKNLHFYDNNGRISLNNESCDMCIFKQKNEIKMNFNPLWLFITLICFINVTNVPTKTFFNNNNNIYLVWDTVFKNNDFK